MQRMLSTAIYFVSTVQISRVFGLCYNLAIYLATTVIAVIGEPTGITHSFKVVKYNTYCFLCHRVIVNYRLLIRDLNGM